MGLSVSDPAQARRGGGHLQLVYATGVPLEAYLTQRGWEEASLVQCPACGDHPRCRLSRHGTYVRKHPVPCPVVRFYCPTAHQTFSLLPDFLASRVPGTLQEIEDAVAIAESSHSQEQAVQELRPAEAADAVTLPSALRWLSRRRQWMHVVLTTVVTLLPELAGCAPRVTGVRERLGHEPVLVELRERSAEWLHVLPAPLGFGPLPTTRAHAPKRLQHSTGSDPPEQDG